MTELVTFGETMLRLSPPPGERLESASELACQSAGAESNVAIAAARLDAGVTWLSKLPDSVLGQRVVSEVRSHGVEPNVVWSEDGRQGTYYVEQAGEPRGTNVIYDREHAAVTTATPDELDTEAVADATMFFTTGITPALSETLFETTEALLETSQTAAFDLNYRSKLWSQAEATEAFDELLPAVDVLFAPERDARPVLDVGGEPEEIVETLRRRYDCELVVLTRGENGALARTAEKTVKQGIFEAETFDPVGSGDAFVGAFLSRYLRGASVSKSLRWGAATAALKRTIGGDVARVCKSEVRAVFEDEQRGINR